MLPIILLLPFLGSLFFFLLPRHRLTPDVPWKMTLIFTGGCLLLLGYATFFPAASGMREFFVDWMPTIGLSFSLWLDGPALFFAWIVTGLGFLIFLYAGFYLDPSDSPWRFFGTMLLFMGSMLGVVMARNALLMFLFWELTSITSFILIGHWHHKDTARAGALKALIVTGAGGLFLMAGVAGMFWILKSSGALAEAGVPLSRALDWDQLWAFRHVLTGHAASGVVMVLLLIGAFSKSAQFPFQFWLPGAMEAPTPVSAFLHAATMVKAGIYLLGRLYPIYSEVDFWLYLVGGVGLASMVIGGFMAMVSRDLKQLLAHSTVSQLGLLTAYYGFGHGMAGTDHKLPLDLMLIASHALFKGALFLLVGVIDHGTHTRDWTRLGGLRKSMPVTATLSILCCASMAGVPLTFGFVAKELFLHASLHVHTGNLLFKYGFPAVAIGASLFTAAYCYRFAISPFFGKPRDESIHAHEGGLGLLISPALMGIVCLLGGLYVPLVEGPLAGWTNAAYYAVESGFTVAFFHHVDLLFFIAMTIFAGGLVIYFAGSRIENLYIRRGSPAACREAYEDLFDVAIPAFAAWLARTIQSPSLQRNFFRTLTFCVVLILGAAWVSGFLPEFSFAFEPIEVMVVLFFVFLAVCIYYVATHRVLLIRVIAFAPVGLVMTVFFVIFEAPDLALTEILVDVAIMIVLLLALVHFPQRFDSAGREPHRVVPIAVACLGGLVMGVLAFAGMADNYKNQPTFPDTPPVHEYYLENTKHAAFDSEAAAVAAGYPGADTLRSGGGNNSVNVILVDFRGIDTMGEISVIGLAAMGVLCLLTMNRLPRERSAPERIQKRRSIFQINYGSTESPAQPPVLGFATWPVPSLILREFGKVVPAFILIFAAVLFFAGHNAPGGGFIGGLMVSMALGLAFVAFRRREITSLHKFDYFAMIPAGLTFAVGTGLVAAMLGFPFLTSAYTHVHLPFFGDLEFASAMGFDFGVFLVVVGGMTMILQRLGGE